MRPVMMDQQPTTCWRLAVLGSIAALFFAALAPTLTWTEFSSGSENLNVATVLEIRRTDRWIIPTLQGKARIAKPPLTAWTTAALLDSATLRDISSSDTTIRHAAFRSLAWQVRWPAVLMACLGLIAVGELGRIMGGWKMGIASALIYGSCYAFLRFSRNATTDVTLTLWAITANLFIAQALFEDRRWIGCLGAGIALGLGFMCKGPVVLVQTVAPAAVYAAWIACYRLIRPLPTTANASSPQASVPSSAALNPPAPKRGWIGPLLAGAVGMVAVATPWFAFVLIMWQPQPTGLTPVELPWYVRAIAQVAGKPELWQFWYSEVTRNGATDLEPSDWYNYVSLFPMMLPWILFFIGGMGRAIGDIWHGGQTTPLLPSDRQQSDPSIARLVAARLGFALLLVIVPILIMSLSRDRKERYLLPLIGPAAILAAYGVMAYLRTACRQSLTDKLGTISHWCIVGIAALLFPLLGATGILDAVRTVDGQPWFGPRLAAAAMAIGLILLVGGILLNRRWPWAIVLVTVLVALVMQGLFTHGYAKAEGLSRIRPLVEEIWTLRPHARLFGFVPKRHIPQDLSIYTNREVRQVASVDQIPPEDRGAVLVMLQRKSEPVPQTPPGWRCIASQRRGKETWHAYERDN